MAELYSITPPESEYSQVSALSAGSRVYFVDYLRAAIINLVLMHHLAITYGASDSWHYQVPSTDPLSALILSLLHKFQPGLVHGIVFPSFRLLFPFLL